MSAGSQTVARRAGPSARVRVVALMIGALTMLFCVVFPAGSASACAGCGGDSANSGYNVTASVRLSGDAAPGGGTTVSMGVPATCWWAPFSQGGGGISPDISATDPSTWLPWYDWYSKNNTGTFTFARAYLGKRADWKAAVAKGGTLGIYVAQCRTGADECAINSYVSDSTPAGKMYSNCGSIPVMYGFYPAGGEPAPAVDPKDLAKIARDAMVIDPPDIDRNPKVQAVGQGTLVGLPTWFWVTNPAAVGGATGTRTIRADVGAVWAEVVAKTDGLSLRSPAGGASCPPAVATTAYTAGASDGSGCTVSFTKASVGFDGGYPVDASTAWTATWTGSDGNGGALDGLARDTQVNVPVAESQALVSGN